jgi:hypothetical protein
VNPRPHSAISTSALLLLQFFGIVQDMQNMALQVRTFIPLSIAAVIAATLHAMATCPVLFARNPAKSAAIIRNAASYVMNLAHHV